MAKGRCRDCSKCTERGYVGATKKLLNLALIVCTLGLSVVASKSIHSGRQMCPSCGHPLTRHARAAGGLFRD